MTPIFNEKNHLLKTFFAAALTLCTALLPLEKAHADQSSLTVVTMGIRDEANDSWVGISSTLAPTKERWVVQQEGVQTSSDLTHVPHNHVITLRSDASPESIKKALSKIENSPNATVLVDMDLNTVNVRPKQDSWTKPTVWAANVTRALAEGHLAEYPDSHNTWIGHSAGTEPMAMLPTDAPGTDRPLFNNIYAMSPRRLSLKYPRQTVMVIADGDFLPSPNGNVPVGSVLGTADEAYAKEQARLGYRVLRIAPGGNQSNLFSTSARAAITAASCSTLMGLYGDLSDRMAAHSETHDVNYPDTHFNYYSPVTAKESDVKATSLGNALETVPDKVDWDGNIPADVQGGVTDNELPAVPTEVPTIAPTEEPSSEVNEEPSPEVSEEPSPEVSEEPSPEVSEEPSPEVSGEPTEMPTDVDTDVPTEGPTDDVTEEPTDVPTDVDTDMPTDVPTDVPSDEVQPTDVPTDVPSDELEPTDVPTDVPNDEVQPTDVPTDVPNDEVQPTDVPTDVPNDEVQPTDVPTDVTQDQQQDQQQQDQQQQDQQQQEQEQQDQQQQDQQQQEQQQQEQQQQDQQQQEQQQQEQQQQEQQQQEQQQQEQEQQEQQQQEQEQQEQQQQEQEQQEQQQQEQEQQEQQQQEQEQQEQQQQQQEQQQQDQ